MNNAIKLTVVQNAEQQAIAERKAQLLAELRVLNKMPKGVTFKVVEFKHRKTGETQVGINIHGVTAKPIFLYGSQALRLVEVMDQLKEFVEANRSVLSWKE